MVYSAPPPEGDLKRFLNYELVVGEDLVAATDLPIYKITEWAMHCIIHKDEARLDLLSQIMNRVLEGGHYRGMKLLLAAGGLDSLLEFLAGGDRPEKYSEFRQAAIDQITKSHAAPSLCVTAALRYPRWLIVEMIKARRSHIGTLLTFKEPPFGSEIDEVYKAAPPTRTFEQSRELLGDLLPEVTSHHSKHDPSLHPTDPEYFDSVLCCSYAVKRGIPVRGFRQMIYWFSL